jgi:hypothetical protein
LDKCLFHFFFIPFGAAFGGAFVALGSALFGFDEKVVGFIKVGEIGGDFSTGMGVKMFKFLPKVP